MDDIIRVSSYQKYSIISMALPICDLLFLYDQLTHKCNDINVVKLRLIA